MPECRLSRYTTQFDLRHLNYRFLETLSGAAECRAKLGLVRVASPHFSRGGGEVTERIEFTMRIVIERETACSQGAPIPALAGSRARAPALESAAMTETGRADAVTPHSAQAGAWRSLPRLASGPVSRPPLVLRSSGSYGCIASRGGSGAPARSGGDLTPGEATTRDGRRSDVPPTGGRIPGCAGGPALRLARVFRSRTACKHTSPAPASGIPVRNAG